MINCNLKIKLITLQTFLECPRIKINNKKNIRTAIEK
jgi:hypothetical protein